MLRFFAVATFLCLSSAAQADLRFCNETDADISIAIGYKDGEAWTSEGWWNAAPGDCSTPVSGDLTKRYYYYRVTSPTMDFPTENYFFCTSAKVFTIVGDTDCKARGYDRNPFNELDTGEARDWTVSLTANDGETTQEDLEQAYRQTYNQVYAALQGFWVDAGDRDIGMRVDDHRLTDYFLGVPGGGATWTLADTCDGAGGAGPVLIVNYDDFADEPLCWVLLGLDDAELSFRAVGGTADIHMLKRN
ncbi:MAG: DUF1036 domain-containing protein [Rhodobacter sp.]|nr:DUF1036 domain-containing protein [Rhodobacter sp.]